MKDSTFTTGEFEVKHSSSSMAKRTMPLHTLARTSGSELVIKPYLHMIGQIPVFMNRVVFPHIYWDQWGHSELELQQYTAMMTVTNSQYDTNAHPTHSSNISVYAHSLALNISLTWTTLCRLPSPQLSMNSTLESQRTETGSVFYMLPLLPVVEEDEQPNSGHYYLMFTKRGTCKIPSTEITTTSTL